MNMVNMSAKEVNNNEPNFNNINSAGWMPPINKRAIFMPSLSRMSIKSNWNQNTIRSLIKQGNLTALEEIVIQGYGDRLIGEVSGIPLIEDFLERIPDLLEQINQLHKLSVRGDVDSFRLLLDRKDLILSRDRLGATPLHKAVIYGHFELIEFISTNYPNSLDSCDHDGRTPLHFAAVLADDRSIYNLLVKQGASTSITDSRGNSPEFYLKNPGQINLKQVIKRSQRLNANYEINTSNRIQAKSPSRRKPGYLSPTSSKRLIESGFGHYFNYHQVPPNHRSTPHLNHVDSLNTDSEDNLPGTTTGSTSTTESSSNSTYPLNKSQTPFRLNQINKHRSNIDNSNNSSYFKIKRSEVTSATVRRWLEEENFAALEAAAFEGFADKIRIKASIYSNDYNIDSNKKKHSALRRRLSQSAFGLDRETGGLGDDFKLERIERASGTRTSCGTNEGLKVYVRETLPKISSKIKAIHAAVSCGDISCLENHLHDEDDDDDEEPAGVESEAEDGGHHPVHKRKSRKDYILAKDHLGMAPLHKAVILGHLDVVQFLLEKFPETINARDRDGRTALHYAAASTNKNGNIIYKMLIRSGADPRTRDVNGKTADYYRIHLLPLPAELSQLARSVHEVQKRRVLKNLSSSKEDHFSSVGKSTSHNYSSSANVSTPNGYFLSPIKSRRRMTIILPNMNEKITSAIYSDNVELLNQLLLDGFGEYMIGRISFSDETRKFLKKVPGKMESIKRLHAAVPVGDLHTIIKELSLHPVHIRSMDENGLMIIHTAVLYDQKEIIDYLVREFSITLSLKDHFGRTALHVAAQNKSTEIYGKLIESGADLRTYDSRGKTPENYMRFHEMTQLNIQRYNAMLSRSCHNVSTCCQDTEHDTETTTSNEAATATNTTTSCSILTPPTPPVTVTGATVGKEEEEELKHEEAEELLEVVETENKQEEEPIENEVVELESVAKESEIEVEKVEETNGTVDDSNENNKSAEMSTDNEIVSEVEQANEENVVEKEVTNETVNDDDEQGLNMSEIAEEKVADDEQNSSELKVNKAEDEGKATRGENEFMTDFKML